MIATLSRRISRYLVANGADASDEDVLTYGAECFLNEVISMVLLVLVGSLTNHVWELLIWSVSFCLLRVNLGGLHATSHGWCIATGTLIGASSLLISPFLVQYVVFAGLLTLAAAVTACLIGPVPHKNKQHVQRKRIEIKQNVIMVVMLVCIASVIFYFASPAIAAYIVSGLILATLLAVAGLLWNPR